MTKAKIKELVREVVTEAGLPHEFTTRLPHQLSSGQRQRLAIARAIVCDPAFVVADEPVSALDMTVQKQILELIRKLQEKRGFACLFVSHDLGAAEQVADRVAMMENGRIVEIGDRDEVFDRPKHPMRSGFWRQPCCLTASSRAPQEAFSLEPRCRRSPCVPSHAQAAI